MQSINRPVVAGPMREPDAHSARAPIVETDVPARLDRLPWSRFHTLVVFALGITWVLDGLEVTLAGCGLGRAHRQPGAALHRGAGRRLGERLSRRRGAGGAGLRLACRPLRTPPAVLRHARRLHRRDRGDRVRQRLLDLRAVPLPDRRGNRWRVRGDQLGDPGADPGALSRPHRPGDQRQLLARRARGCDRHDGPARPERTGARRRLARGVRDRRGARARRAAAAPLPAREPALAVHPRARRARPTRWSPASRRAVPRTPAAPARAAAAHPPRAAAA